MLFGSVKVKFDRIKRMKINLKINPRWVHISGIKNVSVCHPVFLNDNITYRMMTASIYREKNNTYSI